MKENERNIHSEVDQVLRSGERYKTYPVRLGYFQSMWFLGSIVHFTDLRFSDSVAASQLRWANPEAVTKDLPNIFSRESDYEQIGRESILVGLEQKLGKASQATEKYTPGDYKNSSEAYSDNGTPYEIDLSAREVEAIAWAVFRRRELFDHMMFGLSSERRDEIRERELARGGLAHLTDLFDQFTQAGGTLDPTFKQMAEMASKFYNVGDYQI